MLPLRLVFLCKMFGSRPKRYAKELIFDGGDERTGLIERSSNEKETYCTS